MSLLLALLLSQQPQPVRVQGPDGGPPVNVQVLNPTPGPDGGSVALGAVTTTFPTYTNGTNAPHSLTTAGAQRVSILQHEFVFSTANSSSVQLAASATFTGTCENITTQPAYSVLVFSDQPGTLTINQYQDAACANVIISNQFTHLANAGIGRSGTLNGNYYRISYQNTGASTTTKLVVESAFGDILPATQANNVPVSINEINGTAPSTPGKLDVQSIAAALPTGTNVIGKVSIDQTTPGTTNAVSVTNTSLTVAQSTAANLNATVTESTAAGAGNPCQNPHATIQSIAGATSGTASVQLVALSGSTKIFICSMVIVGTSGTTPTFALRYGTGSACGTGTVTIIGAFTTTANTVYSFNNPFFVTPAGQALCYIQTGTTPISSYAISYVQL